MSQAREERGVRTIFKIGPRKLLVATLLGVWIGVLAYQTRSIEAALTFGAIGSALGAIAYLLVDIRRIVLRGNSSLRDHLSEYVDGNVAKDIRSIKKRMGKIEAQASPRSKRHGGAKDTSGVRSASRIKERLWAGFSTAAIAELKQLSINQDMSARGRARAFLSMAEWYVARADYERAYENVALARVADPSFTGSQEQPVLEAEILMRLGRPVEARSILEELEERDGPSPNLHYRIADTYAFPGDGQNGTDAECIRLGLINQILLKGGLLPIERCDDSLPLSIENVATSGWRDANVRPVKVSVIVPAFEAAGTIGTAVRSLLEQTWADLEIIVVDDGSADGTAEAALAAAAGDERVRVVRLPRNEGVYPARNAGFRVASGELITTHDADDWSHAQKIEIQATALLEDPRLMGTMTQWVRVTDSLVSMAPTLRPKVNRIANNMSSLMVRRRVFDEVGLWDAVRASGDGEFLRRCQSRFGEDRIETFLSGVPLAFGRVADGSLTRAAGTGFLSMSHALGARRQYREASSRWHASDDFEATLPWDPKGRVRPFPCPRLLAASERADERRRLDVVILSDFRRPGGTTASNLQEVQAQRRAGLSTGLIHHPVYEWKSEGGEINPKVWDEIDGEGVRLISSGEKIECDVLVVRFPKILERMIDGLPDVRARHVALIANQTPMRSYGSAPEHYYDVRTCHENLLREFGREPTWFPIGPLIRQALLEHHADEMRAIPLSDLDWVNIIDAAAWRRSAPRAVDGIIRVGRHSRDAELKWPEDPQVIRAVYPDAPGFEVHVLGGADVPAGRLGGLPSNWIVHPFNSIDVRRFLEGLDVFVYFHDSRYVEAFGRVLLEALAVGVPVVTSPGFEPLLGEAGIYARPSEVLSIISSLMEDRTKYEQQVQRGWNLVDERFSYDAHIRRLDRLVPDGLQQGSWLDPAQRSVVG